MLFSCLPHTSTFLFRRKSLPSKLPDCFYDYLGNDWSMHIILTGTGNYAYIDRVMSVYRRHPGGICTSETDSNRLADMIHQMKAFNKYLDYKYEKKIKWGIARLAYKYSIVAEGSKNWKAMRNGVGELIGTILYNKKIPRITFVKLFIIAFFPPSRFFANHSRK